MIFQECIDSLVSTVEELKAQAELTVNQMGEINVGVTINTNRFTNSNSNWFSNNGRMELHFSSVMDNEYT